VSVIYTDLWRKQKSEENEEKEIIVSDVRAWMIVRCLLFATYKTNNTRVCVKRSVSGM